MDVKVRATAVNALARVREHRTGDGIPARKTQRPMP